MKPEEFLYISVPGEQDKFEFWKQACLALEENAPEVFIDVLKNDFQYKHHAALVGLQVLGYPAEAIGLGEETYYKVKTPSGDEIIHPKSKNFENSKLLESPLDERIQRECIFPSYANKMSDEFYSKME